MCTQALIIKDKLISRKYRIATPFEKAQDLLVWVYRERCAFVCAFVCALRVFEIIVFDLTFDSDTTFLQDNVNHQFGFQKLRFLWSAPGSPFRWTRVTHAARFHACLLEPQRRFVTERGKRSPVYKPDLLRSAWVIKRYISQGVLVAQRLEYPTNVTEAITWIHTSNPEILSVVTHLLPSNHHYKAIFYFITGMKTQS